MGQYDEALKDFDEARAAGADAPELANSEGIALAESGRVQEALEKFRRAVALRQDDLTAYGNLAWYLAKSGATTETLEVIEAAQTYSADAEPVIERAEQAARLSGNEQLREELGRSRGWRRVD